MNTAFPIKTTLVVITLGVGGFVTFRLFDPVAIPVAVAGETDDVPSDGDAADDPAIWVDSTDPERSLIIGTDKSGGLAVYDLAGTQRQFLAGGERFNNVDLREGFMLEGEEIPLVVAGETTREQLVLFTIDSESRKLVEIPRARINLGVDPEGVAMYRSPSGGFFAFIVGDDRDTDEKGVIEQWSIQPGERFPIEAEKVRRIVIDETAEGMVVDDDLGHLYVAEESRGIWRYPAEPSDESAPVLVAEVNFGDGLRADVEGLAILRRSSGASYLMASSQGSNDFLVYRLGPALKRIGRFEVNEHDGVDGVSHTDGIEVVGVPLGPRYPSGLFVCQDDKNDRGNQNFKLVSVAEITEALGLSPVQ